MMPTYEYECEKCACRFELKRRFGEDAKSPRCPKCRGKVRQLFSPSAILFKGSGFYVTDSRSNRNRPSEEGQTDKAKGGKKEETKADKVQVGRKEEAKADKTEGRRKEEAKADKVQGGKKEERKPDKAEGGRKEEGKADKVQGGKTSESK
jgi:putative FmdB family regulatory protein